ncbi:MAG: hypothetical protein HY287_01635 [Planctomycetes bacterium]|nr:hypothetical protein [Planctomycetota bacterium]MBI3833010.1 hypothetical protein [Planctomycetota bacterium]
MTTKEALRLIQCLADGQCPLSGLPLPPDNPCQQPDMIRALHVAVRALERRERAERRALDLPLNAGNSWTEEEDVTLCAEFEQGKSLRELADTHKRTKGAIESRLEKLGKLPQPK